MRHRQGVWLVFCALTGLPGATPLAAATWSVPGDFSNIGTALGDSRLVSGDTIQVEPGLYTGPENRDLSFRGKDLVLLSTGGPDVTIIDVGGQSDTPHRGFLFAGGQFGFETSAAILDGFTIQNGYMATSPGPEAARAVGTAKNTKHDLSGAGLMFRFDVSPTVRNCIVRNCYSEFTGGGVGVEFGASPTFTNVRILGCDAGVQGGGLTVETVGSPTLIDCVITGCSSRAGGGAALNESTTLEGCSIAGNQALRGGGLDVIWPARVTLRQTVIWNNCATDSGTQVYVDPALRISGAFSLECCVADPSGILDRAGVTKYLGHNVFANPLFCAPEPCGNAPTVLGDYRVQASSPCLPGNNACALPIGGLGGGCSTAVTPASWTEWKSGFRR